MRLKRNKLKGQQPIASSLVVVVAFHSRVGESQMSRRSRWRRNYLQPALTSLPLPSPITCFYFQFIGHMILFRVALLARARLCWWWWSRKWRKINKLQLNTSQRETAGKESVRLGAFNESHESRRLTFGNVNFDWPATRKQFRHRKWWKKIHRACWHFQCRFTSVTRLSRAGNFHRTFRIYFRTLLLFLALLLTHNIERIERNLFGNIFMTLHRRPRTFLMYSCCVSLDQSKFLLKHPRKPRNLFFLDFRRESNSNADVHSPIASHEMNRWAVCPLADASSQTYLCVLRNEEKSRHESFNEPGSSLASKKSSKAQKLKSFIQQNFLLSNIFSSRFHFNFKD